MNRIFMSALVIAGAVGALSIGGTSAFFSDIETSTGNVFTAGDIDLKVDNESYYNGLPSENTSWEAKDLTIEKFFNFNDLKPSDYGEDTISLHVNTNDAYLCADVTLTSNNENGQTEPEAGVDQTLEEGELGDLVNFVWWADDGDNVFETGEDIISSGPIGALTLNKPYPLTLADSDENIWDEDGEGPVEGNQTYYIGKAWCFGTMTPNALSQDGESDAWSPADDNNENDTAGEPEDGGFSCDGSLLGNESQTDSLTADVSFEAVQARNNGEFECDEPEQACIPGEVNVFLNGGFETPEVTNGQKWDVFLAAISNWTVEWRAGLPTTFGSFTRPEPGNFELHEGVLGVALEGNQYIELDSDWNGHASGPNGEPASTVISQTIATVPGDTYTVSYAFAPRPNTPAADNHVEVRWDGNLLHTAGPLAGGGGNLTVGSWTSYGPLQFVATDSSTVISFTDVGTANSVGSFIDNVVVTHAVCTPVP